MRAIKDAPVGVLPLVLHSLCRVLQADYPFLPHQTIHKPLANLITFGARYDTLHMRGSSLSNNSSSNKTSNNSNSASNGTTTSTSSSNSTKSSWRLSGVSSPSSSTKASRFNPQHYKEVVTTGLSELIAVVWKKITRDPAILDFFTVVDVRKKENVTISKPKMTPQMDVLTAMIGLMDHHALGTRAKEGLVLALALRDQRIESFLTQHTTFVYVLVAELSKHFLLAVDSLTYQATCGSPYKLPLVYPPIDTYAPPVVTTSNSQKTTNNNSSSKTLHTPVKSSIPIKPPPPPPSSSSSSSSLPPMPKELTPLESFVKVLRFCEVVFTACARAENTSSGGNAHAHAGTSAALVGTDGGSGNGDGSAGTAQTRDGPAPNPVPDLDPSPPSSLQEALLTVYSEVFLEGPICSTLLVHNKYPMSVAADTVVRVLLSELFLVNRQVYRCTHPILTTPSSP